MNINKSKIKRIVSLFIGMIFLLFSNGRYFFPVAAWLYPLFVLSYTRKTNPKTGYITVAIASAFINQISFWKFTSTDPGSILFYLPVFLSFILALPFLVDRLCYHKLKGILSTIVFPLAYTSIEFIYASLSPFGSTGVLGYSQYGLLPVVQIVSITGIWGLSFVITWFGSFLNYIRSNLSDIYKIKKEIIIYCLIILTVFLYGSVRLVVPPSKGTVKVSGIHVYDLRGSEGLNLREASLNDWEKYRKLNKDIEDRLFKATIKQARAGSKIIVWSEISPQIAKEDEKEFLKRAKHIAQKEKIYLVTSPYVIHKSPNEKDENKLLIFDPSGKTVLTHYKYGGNFLEGSVKGDKVIQTVQTKFGILSGVICWDQDFPAIIKQAGLKKVDILAGPAADWKQINPIHTVVGYFRGIENGFSLIRQTVNGLSIITDSKGRIISKMDHYASDNWTMSGNVPVKGSFTLYPIIGDLFAWLSLAGLLVIIYIAYKTEQ